MQHFQFYNSDEVCFYFTWYILNFFSHEHPITQAPNSQQAIVYDHHLLYATNQHF